MDFIESRLVEGYLGVVAAEYMLALMDLCELLKELRQVRGVYGFIVFLRHMLVMDRLAKVVAYLGRVDFLLGILCEKRTIES